MEKLRLRKLDKNLSFHDSFNITVIFRGFLISLKFINKICIEMEKLKHFKSSEKLIYEMKDIPFITSCISTTFSYTAAGVSDVNISKILDGLPQVWIEDSRLLETLTLF